ncbi:MAG: transposase [Firmicutes bacterium]|nr:transposase [Bacillota bacterium]
MERLPDDCLLPEEPRPEGRRRGTAGHGRRRYPQLPANHPYFEASDEAQRCPRCGTYARKCGIDTSTQWEFVVEIRPQVAHRQRYRRVCECGGQDVVESDRNALAERADLTPPAADPSEASEAKTSVAIPRGFTAPGPLSVIPRGLFTHQLLIPGLAWKYLWGVPLHRLRQVWKTQRADIAAGSLVGALQPRVPIFEPWYEALKKVNQAEPWRHADETHWKVFAETAGKVGYRWWLWVFSGPESTVYLLSPTRGAKVPIDYLQGDGPTDGSLPSWWYQRLITDFFGAYRAMLAGIPHAWCWAHIRRKFLVAGRVPGLTAWSELWVQRIARLYRLQALWKSLKPESMRWSIVDSHLRRWVDSMATVWRQELADPNLTQAARMVLATVERQWDGLTLFLEYPEIP